MIEVAVLLVIVAAVPPKVTDVAPLKSVPVMITPVCPPATGPLAGAMLVMVGAAVTVKDAPLLATPLTAAIAGPVLPLASGTVPPTVTTTFPVLAPAGTTATIEVALQLVIDVALVPLKETVLVPCMAPKLEPIIVTEAPTGPELGERLVIAGAAWIMVKLRDTGGAAFQNKSPGWEAVMVQPPA